jgi:hypothetical protein
VLLNLLIERQTKLLKLVQLLETPELPPAAPAPAPQPLPDTHLRRAAAAAPAPRSRSAVEHELEKCVCGHAREFHVGVDGTGECSAPNGCECGSFSRWTAEGHKP